MLADDFCEISIAAVYVLSEARPPLKAGIVRANFVDGALMIERNAYRPAMIARMGQAALYFEAARAIARHAGVFTLTRAMEFAGQAAVTGWLEAHWRALAEAPQAPEPVQHDAFGRAA